MSQHTPAHGGDLVSASAQYHIDINQWIDLSTGINPIAYPIKLEESSFQQLPYIRPEFIDASTNYYRSSQFLAVTGTQAAIQQLPKLLADFPVLLPRTAYQEHRKYWQEKTTEIRYYDSDAKDTMHRQIDNMLANNTKQHLVIVNPNNPTGVLLEKEQLLNWAKKLGKGAYLLIDEAFIDTYKEQSVLSEDLPENIIVLRSFGKFFGLAGVRLGYCFASTSIISRLQKKLGLWQVNGPAQSLAIQALSDKKWHMHAISDIYANNQFMQELWAPLFEEGCIHVFKTFHSSLFLSYELSSADALSIRNHFAKLGVLLRIISLPGNDELHTLLRIGLIDQHNKTYVKRLRCGINSFINIQTGN